MTCVVFTRSGGRYVMATLAVDDDDGAVIFKSLALPQTRDLAPGDYVLGYQAFGDSGTDVTVSVVDQSKPSDPLGSSKTTIPKNSTEADPDYIRFSVEATLRIADLKKFKGHFKFEPPKAKRKGKGK